MASSHVVNAANNQVLHTCSYAGPWQCGDTHRWKQ